MNAIKTGRLGNLPFGQNPFGVHLDHQFERAAPSLGDGRLVNIVAGAASGAATRAVPKGKHVAALAGVAARVWLYRDAHAATCASAGASGSVVRRAFAIIRRCAIRDAGMPMYFQLWTVEIGASISSASLVVPPSASMTATAWAFLSGASLDMRCNMR